MQGTNEFSKCLSLNFVEDFKDSKPAFKKETEDCNSVVSAGCTCP